MGLSSLELWRLAGDELNVIELIKSENSNLCGQPNVEEQVHSGAPTDSLCKSLSVGHFVPSKQLNKQTAEQMPLCNTASDSVSLCCIIVSLAQLIKH